MKNVTLLWIKNGKWKINGKEETTQYCHYSMKWLNRRKRKKCLERYLLRESYTTPESIWIENESTLQKKKKCKPLMIQSQNSATDTTFTNLRGRTLPQPDLITNKSPYNTHHPHWFHRPSTPSTLTHHLKKRFQQFSALPTFEESHGDYES